MTTYLSVNVSAMTITPRMFSAPAFSAQVGRALAAVLANPTDVLTYSATEPVAVGTLVEVPVLDNVRIGYVTGEADPATVRDVSACTTIRPILVVRDDLTRKVYASNKPNHVRANAGTTSDSHPRATK